ncbi:hypothetical protein BKA64DRAFT_639818 [Cadophora sp. MPI-SDFR-AT-0126]|nr:hypothetical protein BKA64DRAFT_639818 [Leotiomycetes sp. MPI-SDFR-AT-0126]
MAQSRSRATPRNLHSRNAQEAQSAPMQVFPIMNLSRFDLQSTKLHSLQERLKAFRQSNYELTLEAADIEHQLYMEWDSLSLGSKAARDRHNEIALEHKEWYRELRDMHKQRIHKLEKEIQQESDFMNWREWSPIELLIRWKSGNMDYSIFKEHEATYRVQDAFRLEAGLQPPKLKLIAMVSAQVAAGWYKVPTESIDWENRIPVPGFVDENFAENDKFDANTCTTACYPQYDISLRGKSKQTGLEGEYRQDTLRIIPMGNVEQRDWDESQQSTHESTYKKKVDNWNWDVRPSSGSFIAIEEQPNFGDDFIRIKPHQSTELDLDLNFDIEDDGSSITGNHLQAGPSWVHNYPSYKYSQEELEDIAAKAYAPEKPKKVVPMIAGRPFSKPIVAHEYMQGSRGRVYAGFPALLVQATVMLLLDHPAKLNLADTLPLTKLKTALSISTYHSIHSMIHIFVMPKIGFPFIARYE